MRARKSLSALIVAFFLAFSVPAPGWGAGGQDIVLDKGSSSSALGNGLKHDAASPRVSTTGRLNAGGARPQQPKPDMTWLAWAWNMFVNLYGQFFGISSDDTQQ